MNWSEDQKKIIDKYSNIKGNLDKIDDKDKRYKCSVCFLILNKEDLVDGNCPVCNTNTGLSIMCPLDHNKCSHDIIDIAEFCPICNQPICPHCGTHDVAQISRVTGYLSEVSGWNEGKKQEFKDRQRYNPA